MGRSAVLGVSHDIAHGLQGIYYTMLYYTRLYYTRLDYTILYSTILYYTVNMINPGWTFAGTGTGLKSLV